MRDLDSPFVQTKQAPAGDFFMSASPSGPVDPSIIYKALAVLDAEAARAPGDPSYRVLRALVVIASEG
jgi:hypothetical protein